MITDEGVPLNTANVGTVLSAHSIIYRTGKHMKTKTLNDETTHSHILENTGVDWRLIHDAHNDK